MSLVDFVDGYVNRAMSRQSGKWSSEPSEARCHDRHGDCQCQLCCMGRASADALPCVTCHVMLTRGMYVMSYMKLQHAHTCVVSHMQ